jgi:hypothetical protein
MRGSDTYLFIIQPWQNRGGSPGCHKSLGYVSVRDVSCVAGVYWLKRRGKGRSWRYLWHPLRRERRGCGCNPVVNRGCEGPIHTFLSYNRGKTAVTPMMWDSGLCVGAGCLMCGWSILVEKTRKRQEQKSWGQVASGPGRRCSKISSQRMRGRQMIVRHQNGTLGYVSVRDVSCVAGVYWLKRRGKGRSWRYLWHRSDRLRIKNLGAKSRPGQADAVVK